METDPVQGQLRILHGLPIGNGCTWPNGYQLHRNNEGDFHVVITYLEVSDPSIVCTTQYHILETIFSLGSDFEADQAFSISVNSEPARTFEP